MDDILMFPVLDDPIIKAVPWEIVESHENQAKSNHDQSLNRLSQRGGLGIEELEYVLLDKPTNWQLKITPKEKARCRANLMKLLYEFELQRLKETEDGSDRS